MPGTNGVNVLEYWRESWPQIRGIVFSGHTDVDRVRGAFQRGALGDVFKGDVFKGDVSELIDGIWAVATGEYFLSARF